MKGGVSRNQKRCCYCYYYLFLLIIIITYFFYSENIFISRKNQKLLLSSFSCHHCNPTPHHHGPRYLNLNFADHVVTGDCFLHDGSLHHVSQPKNLFRSSRAQVCGSVQFKATAIIFSVQVEHHHQPVLHRLSFTRPLAAPPFALTESLAGSIAQPLCSVLPQSEIDLTPPNLLILFFSKLILNFFSYSLIRSFRLGKRTCMIRGENISG